MHKKNSLIKVTDDEVKVERVWNATDKLINEENLRQQQLRLLATVTDNPRERGIEVCL